MTAVQDSATHSPAAVVSPTTAKKMTAKKATGGS